MRKRTNKKGFSGFRKFLLIYVCVFAAAVLAGLSVFYVYIAQYENSRTDTVVRKLIESADDEYWAGIIKASYDIETGEYETSDTILRECYLEKITGNILSFRRDYTHTGDSDTVYGIYSGDCRVALVRLTDSGKRTFFGFTVWNDDNVSLAPEAFAEFDPKDYTIEVPMGSKVSVNGAELDEALGEIVVYSALSPFESALSDKYKSVKYVISGLHRDPDIKSSLDGETLECEKTDHVYSYSYPSSKLHCVVVTIPSEASLKINGIAVGESYKTHGDISYDDISEYDKAAKTKRTLSEYSVSGLVEEPSVSVVLNGKELSGTNGVYKLPESEKHTLAVKVPAGASVKVNGIALGKEYISSSDDRYPDLSEFEKYMTTVPSRDVYTLDGLYNLPEVTVTDASGRAQLEESSDGDGYTYSFIPNVSENAKAEYEPMVREFTEKYIYYTSQGYNNIDENNAAVLAYMIPGTDAYKRVANSTIGLMWNSPFTSVEYNSFVTDSYIQFGSDSFSCEVKTDITMKMAGLVKNYKSHMKLLYVKTYDGWKIGDMRVLG